MAARVGPMHELRKPLPVGEMFGNLLLIAEAEDHTITTPGKKKQRKRQALVRCICGREHIVAWGNLKIGKTKSCGHTPCSPRWEGHYLGGGWNKNVVYLGYRQKARKVGISFLISREQFDELTDLNCHYCGSPPSNEMSSPRGDRFIYNGLDRVDNSQGYEIDNVVPSCMICNRAKTNMATEEWVAWIKRLYSMTAKGNRKE